MTTKDIRTSHAHTVCDVCGRTLLRGERAEIYINGGARRSVCELCRPRAVHEGWIREGTLPDYNQSGAGTERRRSLLNRLRNRRDGRRGRGRPSLDDELAGYDPGDGYDSRDGYEPRDQPVGRGRDARPRFDDGLDDARWDTAEPPEPDAGAGAEPPVPSPAPYRAHEHDDSWPEDDFDEAPAEGDFLDVPPPVYGEEPERPPPDAPAPSRRPWSRPPRSLRSEPGADRGARSSRSSRRPRRSEQPGGLTSPDARGAQMREPRHVRAVPAGQEQKMAAAVDLFNQSEHRRTVAGVARSLGGAGVAVLPAADPPSLVHIVVWWELCWYRYTVDLSDAVPGVRVDGQGYELSELSDSERSANATADESGQLSLR